ncbi:MAG TPA: PIN domain-containing protein [Gemmatimonadaceae bacterium]|nr:PIN domain-containing protein [Gemmatimonadaceae bacterium]
MTAIADTGVLYALMDRDDAWHARVRSWWERTREHVLVPVTVLPEITYLLARRLGALAELEFTRAVAAGEFTVEALLDEDIARRRHHGGLQRHAARLRRCDRGGHG